MEWLCFTVITRTTMHNPASPHPWIQEAALGFLVLLALLVIAGAKVLRWSWLLSVRVARAGVLLFYTPRPIDGAFYHFCFPDHA
jgi:hypothetical protein